MALYILIAVLCVVPFASSMFLPHRFGPSFDIDAPDTKMFRRNAFGQLQAFDVSHDHTFVRNAAGNIQRFNIMELSDPEVYSNTVGGGAFGLQSPFMSPMNRFGTPGLSSRSMGISTTGLGATTAANPLGMAGSSFSTYKMPLGMSTLNNYVGSYDPYSMMF